MCGKGEALEGTLSGTDHQTVVFRTVDYRYIQGHTTISFEERIRECGFI